MDDRKPLLEPASDGIYASDSYGSVQEGDARSGDQVDVIEATKRRWRSIRVLYITMFFNSVAFSIVAVSLYPYLQHVDSSATVAFLGWTNTGYSFAQAVGSLVFGAWCLYRPAIEPLIVSNVLFAAGSLLYSYAPAFHGHGMEVILIGRIILGFSTGVVAVCRTVASQMSTVKERATVMAHLALAQAFGFLIGPAMQACLQPIGERGAYFAPLRLYLNVYTAVGYLGVFLSVIMLLLFVCYFREATVDIYQDSWDNPDNQAASLLSIVRVDRIACGIVIVVFFIVLLIFAVGETIISPLLMHEFAWTHDNVLLYGSLILAGSGLLSIVVFLVCGMFAKRFGERKVLFVSFLILTVTYVMYLPWGNEYPALQSTEIANVSSHSHDTLPGCPTTYSWCTTTPKIYFAQFIAVMVIGTVGYSSAMVMTSTLFSKILGPTKQGLAMGLLSASGSLARTVGPIIVSTMYVQYGPRWTFVLVIAWLLCGASLIAAAYRRFVPYHVHAKKRLLHAIA